MGRSEITIAYEINTVGHNSGRCNMQIDIIEENINWNNQTIRKINHYTIEWISPPTNCMWLKWIFCWFFLGEVTPLTELAARCVASFIPFELVEHVFPPVPEQLQLRIAFWSFPDNEEDIRLYSCLANSSADEFHRGDSLFKNRAVKDPLQIGFHLSATVVSTQPRNQFNVAVTFDRRRISSCNCTCTSSAYWCSHVVAVCLYRIHCVSFSLVSCFTCILTLFYNMIILAT